MEIATHQSTVRVPTRRSRWKAAIWPGRRLVRGWIVTAVSMWVLIHFVLFVASGEPQIISSSTGLISALGAAAVVGTVDMRRKRESILLRNLGVMPFAAPAFWIATFIFLEIALAALLRMR